MLLFLSSLPFFLFLSDNIQYLFSPSAIARRSSVDITNITPDQLCGQDFKAITGVLCLKCDLFSVHNDGDPILDVTL